MWFSVPRFSTGTCSVSNVTPYSVRLSWPAVTGAYRYRYRYGSRSVYVYGTSASVSGLTPATHYYFHVTVYGSYGTGNTIVCSATTGKSLFL